MKLTAPDRAHFEQHYGILFGRILDYATSGPVCAMVWEGDNAVATGRKMLGAPLESKIGTIRGDFCNDVGHNICHGSDSVESANSEIALWFTDEELCSWTHHTQAWVRE